MTVGRPFPASLFVSSCLIACLTGMLAAQRSPQRSSVISGRVLDVNGQPLADAQVIALRPFIRSQDGRLMVAGPSVRTNDLGEFRIHSLAAGEYLVQASPDFTRMARATTTSLATLPTFYPGTNDVSAAQPVRLAVGETLNGIEIKLLQGPTFSVAGVVVDDASWPVADAVVTIDADPPGMLTFIPRGQTRTADDGRFSFDRVPAGPYVVRAAQVMLTNDGATAIGPSGPAGRTTHIVETGPGVTSDYRFDPSLEARIHVEGNITGLQVTASRQ